MSITADIRVLSRLISGNTKGNTHQERLESFYSNQADHYDGFRKRLLPGRAELIEQLSFSKGGVWVDMGAGTGWNLEANLKGVRKLKKVYLVDLSPSLLRLARQRVKELRLTNVEVVQSDALRFKPKERASFVTLSYSLSMMPDWIGVLDNVRNWLSPKGKIGVVDFYVSRKHESKERVRHSWVTRNFWPMWFAWDNVFLNDAQLPTLQTYFKKLQLKECRSKIPYLPIGKVPYYLFIGRPYPTHKAS